MLYPSELRATGSGDSINVTTAGRSACGRRSGFGSAAWLVSKGKDRRRCIIHQTPVCAATPVRGQADLEAEVGLGIRVDSSLMKFMSRKQAANGSNWVPAWTAISCSASEIERSCGRSGSIAWRIEGVGDGDDASQEVGSIHRPAVGVAHVHPTAHDASGHRLPDAFDLWEAAQMRPPVAGCLLMASNSSSVSRPVFCRTASVPILPTSCSQPQTVASSTVCSSQPAWMASRRERAATRSCPRVDGSFASIVSSRARVTPLNATSSPSTEVPSAR